MALSEDDKYWMEGMETRILGEFHKVQERSDVRFIGLEANMRAAQVRLDDVEARLSKLEAIK